MKKYFLIIISYFLICCDTIEPPYLQSNTQVSQRTVIIEKFTGHKCSGCPDATKKIKELQNEFPDAIIPVAIHPGGELFDNFTGTDDNHPYDFTTSSSNTIANDMGVTFLPLGTVNRVKGGLSGGQCFTKDQWATEIYKLLYDAEGNPLEKKFDINIMPTFNKKSKELIIEAKVIALTDLQSSFKLAILITEDGIISAQDDDDKGLIAGYEHNNIYRCAVNGTYGENMSNSKVFKDQFEYHSTHTLILDQEVNQNWTSEWDNIDNCYIVAYVYDIESEIIQEGIKIAIKNE